MKMTMDKALAAVGVSIVGLGVTLGFLDEPQSVAAGAVVTALANVVAVWLVPNREK